MSRWEKFAKFAIDKKRCAMKKNHHDYSEPGLFWIAIESGDALGLFDKELCEVMVSQLGQEVCRIAQKRLPTRYPNLSIPYISIAPTALNIIVSVEKPFREGEHLGKVITSLRKWCNKAYWGQYAYHGEQLFGKGYRDQPLAEAHLGAWIDYIDKELQRFWMHARYPELNTTINTVSISGQDFMAVGSPFLLDIPYKEAVIASDAESTASFKQIFSRWAECAQNGGVLVSAATTNRERWVMTEGMKNEWNLVWVCQTDHAPRYIRHASPHVACKAGKLLILSRLHEAEDGIPSLPHESMVRLIESLAQAAPCEYSLTIGQDSGFVSVPPKQLITYE